MEREQPGPGPVLIVGAGPTGLTAALLLARHGVACTVLERRAGIHPLPRAVHLDDEGARILQRAGIGDAFAGISIPAAGLRLLDAQLRPFAEFHHDRPVGVHGHPESNLFHQPDLERLLREELARQPLAQLRECAEVTDVSRPDGRPDSVLVHLTDARTGAREQLSAAAVLGCDGAGSTVRDAIGARLRDLRFTERWFVLDVRSERPLPTWGGVDQICDPRRAATFLPLPGDRYRWEFRMRPGETAEEMMRPVRIATLTKRWGTRVGDLDVLRAGEYTFRARIADRWRRGRVLLLGDAAHLTPPFIGQGLGAGLRDAHNLAWKLAAVLDGGDEDTLLDSYQAERGPHAEAVIHGAVLVGHAMTGGQDLVAALRRPAAGLLLRIPGVRTAAQRGIATRYGPGPLVERRRHRRDLSGTPCPQPTVQVDGRPVRLDEVLGDGYALLATGSAPRSVLARARRLGARTLHLGPGPHAGDMTIEDGEELLDWLEHGRASAALLRPDRIVLETTPR
ncbi:bifunctional 3-(3-hydroxy-phenyl)propionate/3-hydroxycinnamic acid hydroxylase [Pseudonocardia sp. CA-142604]|uniref:bifunctional 3-(3-hydroxy-phenyl)propionate/3-hydroxycinnamic acid hydroxylase MhpA n=1 Tax=Pseudonocardia sp. CA-142604 TaxID=3240024 RepID=UPI003D92FF04